MAELNDYFEVEIIEKETYNFEFDEKEIFTSEIHTIDYIPKITNINDLDDVNAGGAENYEILVRENNQWINYDIQDLIKKYSIYQQEPTKLTAKKFQTNSAWLTGTLEVFLNGQQLLSSDITIVDLTKFKLSINTDSSDEVRVNYLKRP